MKKENKLKKITGWLHLWAGLISGLVILTAALTGSLLVFEDELELIFFKERHVIVPGLNRLTADELIAYGNKAFNGEKVSRLIISAEVNRSTEARIGKKGKDLKIAYIDPYSGKILYKGVYEKQFFKQVTGTMIWWNKRKKNKKKH